MLLIFVSYSKYWWLKFLPRLEHQSLFSKIEFLTYTIIFLYFVKNVTLVWLINLHAYVHSLRFGFFWTFLLSSNVAKTYLSIPWEIDSVVGCTLEIIHLLPVCKGKAKMLKMKPSFLIFSIRLNIRTIYLKLVLNKTSVPIC